MGKPKTVVENRVRKETTIVAYEQQCVSPSGVRKIVHRTDVIDGDLDDAKQRSQVFVNKYMQQSWGVTVRAVTV
jgi:hypothetical protein